MTPITAARRIARTPPYERIALRLSTNGRVFTLALAAAAATTLAGCMGGGEEETRTQSEAQTRANASGHVTLKQQQTTLTIESLRDVSFPSGVGSFLTIQGEVGGEAAIHRGSCGDLGNAVVDLGDFYGLLASTVNIKFDALTERNYSFTVDDSYCADLHGD